MYIPTHVNSTCTSPSYSPPLKTLPDQTRSFLYLSGWYICHKSPHPTSISNHPHSYPSTWTPPILSILLTTSTRILFKPSSLLPSLSFSTPPLPTPLGRIPSSCKCPGKVLVLQKVWGSALEFNKGSVKACTLQWVLLFGYIRRKLYVFQEGLGKCGAFPRPLLRSPALHRTFKMSALAASFGVYDRTFHA